MILDAKVQLPESPSILALELGDRYFNLTGSRFIGGWESDSDWDFVVQYDDLLESYLQAAGFRESAKYDKAPGKNDGYTLAVYESTFGDSKIQVQVTQNVGAKLTARDLIRGSKSLYAKHLLASTPDRIKIWNILCSEPDKFKALELALAVGKPTQKELYAYLAAPYGGSDKGAVKVSKDFDFTVNWKNWKKMEAAALQELYNQQPISISVDWAKFDKYSL